MWFESVLLSIKHMIFLVFGIQIEITQVSSKVLLTVKNAK